MSGTTPGPTETEEGRVDKLAEQLDDLAQFVGRLTYAVFGDEFNKYDPRMSPLLEWEEEVVDAGTDDEAVFGRWVYDEEVS